MKWGVNFVIMSEKSNIISIFEDKKNKKKEGSSEKGGENSPISPPLDPRLQFFWGALSFPFVVPNYLRIEAPPFCCKWRCCIEPMGMSDRREVVFLGNKIWFV